ncbi:MAG: 16S rRNA (guanine(527)-N(7))-methyltransferase RsmG [Caulobacteraceae bacterium]|nr:16S rRNA (guanine(527)-N(7))-methyltransferase RsmG [Caulobacter sp.]
MSDAPPDASALPASADALAARLGLGEAAAGDFARYRELLEDWSGRMNLVGPSALADFWPRHAADCAQLLALAPQAVRWADLGSGAGLPGMILAIALKGRPRAEVLLVESLQKRCRFLEAVVDTLKLPARVVEGRAEVQTPPAVEVVTARAVAPLDTLFGYALPFMRKGATGLFLKGRGAQAELDAARRRWRVRAELLPSATDAEARIVRVRSLARG